MPSGAKKRKAAKKKKEKETTTNPSTNNPQGNDEFKSQDEKGSDGGECGSPASHDHDDDHHHPFNEGNGQMEERDPSAAQPSVSDAKSVEEIPGDVKTDEAVGRKEDSVDVIEWDVKSEESCESKDVNVVHTESAKESDHGNGNFGGSSNVETVTEKNSRDEPSDSIKETITFDELVKSIDSSHAKTMLITEHAPVEETGKSAVESSVDSGKSSDTGNALREKPVASPIGETDLALKKTEDKVYPISDDTVRTSSLEGPKLKEFDNKVLASVSRSPLPESTNGAEHVKDSDTPECSGNQPLVASAPRMVQKTSWLNCCGLFEVLSGSNR